MDERNKLYFGDNLKILRDYVADASVDLIYLDPPFNSSATYNVLFKEKSGEESAAQIMAFEDTWQWGRESEAVYREIVESGPRKLADVMQALLAFLGRNDMMAYLVMMGIRLVELHRVLKPTGSIYLHCDPTASHYLKLLLDAVFDPRNFRSEIVWRRTGSHNKTLRYAPIHDTVFFYSKASRHTWNFPKRPYMKGHVEENFIKDDTGYKTAYYGNVLTGSGKRKGESGKPWRGFNPTAKNRHWAVPGAVLDDIDEDLSSLGQHQKLDRLFELGYIKIIPGQAWPIYERCLKAGDGQFAPDIWAFQPYTEGTVFGTDRGVDEDVRWLSPKDQERLGYPTQKPEGLLERIIRASSNEGEVVLDPFCGCGTTIAVAERLRRKWIGIDITYLAINLVQRRLRDHFKNELSPYEIIGAPTDLKGAEALKEISPHQFEWWAVDLVNAQPGKDHKKGADTGIDGYINFFDDKSGKAKQVIVQVKSGYVGVNHVRDLKGVLEREKAAIGALITLREPTKPMLTEAAATGFYESKEFPGRYPRLQILTIAELLAGKKVEYPAHRVETFAKAERKTKSEQTDLF